MLIFLISVQTSFKNVASSSFSPAKEAACLRIHSKNKNLLNKWTLLFLLPIIIIVHFKKLTIELGRMDERQCETQPERGRGTFEPLCRPAAHSAHF